MGRTTSQKLQKERKRKERQEMKAQKRAERKSARTEASNQLEGTFEAAERPNEPNP
jgi:hypothetical protein